MRPLQVLVLGDDRFARRGLAVLLDGFPGVEVAGDVPTDEAVGVLEAGDIDVALWDLAGAASRAGLRAVPAVVLVEGADQGLEALVEGARAVIHREDGGPERIAAALRAVHEGLIVVDPDFATHVLRTPPTGELPGGEPLTPRELEVLELIALGLSNREVAGELQISPHTAKFHVGSLLDKLGATTRTEAVVLAARLGLLVL